MGPSREDRRERYRTKTRTELEGLVARGVVMAGNAFSPVLLLKGTPTPDELNGAALLAGEDGRALRAALQALGYAPEEWVGLAAWSRDGGVLSAALLREAVCALDPDTIVVCDADAASLVREAYAAELASLESFEEAMLADGLVVQVAGMRAISLGGFAAALSSPSDKQVMWRRLKRVPPLGEPY